MGLPPADVERWVAALDSDDFETRQRATHNLRRASFPASRQKGAHLAF